MKKNMKSKFSIAPRLVMVSSGLRTASREKVISDWMNGARVILHIPRRGKPDKRKPFYNRKRL